ncbi:MAG: penicillin-binding protein, partial [Mesorhizobium sp.]
IPGLDHPWVDPEVAAKAEEEAKKEAADAAAQAEAERPPVLSSRTTQTLRAMTKAFQAAPALNAPTLPETLSAL